MRSYNDYEKTVYGYLRNYHKFRGQLAGLKIEIEGVEEQIRSIGDAKISKYGDAPVGGYDELSEVERACVRRMKLEERLPILRENYLRIQTLLRRIDNALQLMSDTHRTILQRKFIDGERWYQVAQATGYSERSCQYLAQEGIRTLTQIMFPEAGEGQRSLDFVFLENCG
nr:MAG TPA: Protein of unknown function (DUF722) [Caudoviricetes sp.]